MRQPLADKFSKPLGRLDSWSIGSKMVAVAVVACLSLAVTGLLTGSKLSALRYSEREAGTKSVVEAGYSVIEAYAARADAGEMTVEEAQAGAIATIKSMRYGQDDYYWIHDDNTFMVMHPFKPQLDGTDISGVADPNGTMLFVEMNEVVAADGAGFVAYEWPKPGLEDPQPKISYVAGFEPWGWVIGSGVYIDDISSAVFTDWVEVGFIFLVTTGLLLGVILLMRESITKPLIKMTDLLDKGDLTSRLDEGANETELDRLATAINGNLDRVRGVVDGVVLASNAVREQVEQLNHHTDEIESQANLTAERAGEATESTRAAAEGLDRMNNAVTGIDQSIRTISNNAQNVSAVADNALEIATRTNELVVRLGASSSEIGAVVETINNIAEKTNLLALNATIEASRAGEAGRGFAVVADEVKELARATGEATEDIARQIETLQLDANESAEAIKQIDEIVAQLNDVQAGIAVAVEEQTASMSAVSNGVIESSEAGAGAGAVIASVADSAQETRSQLDHISSSVGELDAISRQLEGSIAVFAKG